MPGPAAPRASCHGVPGEIRCRGEERRLHIAVWLSSPSPLRCSGSDLRRKQPCTGTVLPSSIPAQTTSDGQDSRISSSCTMSLCKLSSCYPGMNTEDSFSALLCWLSCVSAAGNTARSPLSSCLLGERFANSIQGEEQTTFCLLAGKRACPDPPQGQQAATACPDPDRDIMQTRFAQAPSHPDRPNQLPAAP